MPSLERYVVSRPACSARTQSTFEGQVSTIGSVGEARWTYAVSKLAGEHMAHAYHDELGLPSVTVHPFNIFGPGQIGGGAIRAFIEAALAGRDLVIHNDGSQIRAWTYVTDMVSGVLACLEHESAVGQAFNIGNPRGAVTIYDLAQRIKRRAGATGAIVFEPRHHADVELHRASEGARGARLGAAGQLDEGLEEDDRVVPAEGSRIRLGNPTSAPLNWPRLRPCSNRDADDGAEGGRVRGELARLCQVKHALAVSSGTAALHVAVLRARSRAGDGVVARVHVPGDRQRVALPD